ncbi:MAG: AI-2E family transporter, partial [Anaerolineae bacterium]|nr:AI-2E family transporter [Anaerolineae bacterium]
NLVPRSYKRDVQLLIREIDQVWKAFFRGQVTLSLIVTIILTVVSTVLGLPYPLLLGIWGGLLEFLPSIGNMIWGATVVLAALLEGSTYLPIPNTTFALIVVVVYVVFAQVDVNILIPNIIGRHVKLHPMVVLIGVIIGISVGGVLGVALAAPTIASLRIIGRYIYAKLFHMYPFPMVGPPSAPWQERLAEITPPAAPESLAEASGDKVTGGK